MPEKRYLFTPGPTPVPPEVLEVLARQVIHQRGPDFNQPYERLLGRLKDVFRTEYDVLLFTSSGTGAFESAVANLTEPGERAVVVSSGSFGERWAAMATRYGADVDHLRHPWGETPDPLEVRARIEGAAVVYVVHSETSTGVVSDVQALAAAAREAGAPKRRAPVPARTRARRGRRDARTMRIRAAVLERTGGPMTVTELELAQPGAGEVLVRLHASGVCYSDQNEIDRNGVAS